MPDEETTSLLRPWSAFVKADRSVWLRIAIALGLIVTVSALFPHGETFDLESKVGQVWARNDLIAPFSFPIYRDDTEYAAEVAAARERVYPVFTRIPRPPADRLLDSLLLQVNRGIDARRGGAGISDAGTPSAGLPFALTVAQWDALARSRDSGRWTSMGRDLLTAATELTRRGVLQGARSDLRNDTIAVRAGTLEVVMPAGRVADDAEISSVLSAFLASYARTDSAAAVVAARLARAALAPTIAPDSAATRRALAAAAADVPRTLGMVQEFERIVGKHERITPEIRLKLESLRRVRADREPDGNAAARFAGTMLHVAVVVMLYGIYLALFRRRIFSDPRRLTLIALLLLLQAGFAYLTRVLDVRAPVEYLIFVPATAMLLTILFDSRVAFYGTVVSAFIVAGVRGNDYSVALGALVAGALAVYTVRDVRNRTQIFRSLVFIFLGYGLTIAALALERSEPVPRVLEQLGFALANAVVSPILTYGLLIFLERFFGVTTDLTLIELSHFRHPLLRMLAEKAPGTYHHSLNMATLAEAAAAAVGANEVLARVGAYFHDIGKIEKPRYFAENQKGSRNRHDKLSPRMSSLIIQAHVKDGIALGREHRLPSEVVDFIPMHHGTTRIDYFYSKALRLAESSEDETKLDEIIETDYRYPGPKPQTKETGILMLADTIEAAARSLDDPSPQRLEQLIGELIRKRFEEGELDECPLTLKDLTKIRAAFLAVLIGMYHSRVSYEDSRASIPGARRAPRAPRRKPPGLTGEPAEEQGSAEPATGEAPDGAPPAGGESANPAGETLPENREP